MTAIEVRFSGHGYHATPWGRHVNEGAVEWPPSPYRLLRGLYDTWKRKRPEWSCERVERVLAALASQLPEFELPVATASHTRSYLNSNKEDPTQKSLIFDGFVIVPRGAPLQMIWPSLDLDTEVKQDLAELLDLLNYLGRSESWVVARFSESSVPVKNRCRPLAMGDGDGEVVQVACAVSRDRYVLQRQGKKATTWIEALAYSTSDLIQDKRSDPPLLERVSYLRPFGCLDDPPLRERLMQSKKVNAVRFMLDGKVLPLVTSTMEIGEQVRIRLMGSHKRRMGGDESRVSPRFSGKDSTSTPLKDHSHCFILPMDVDHDGRIDQIFIHCRDGFATDERMALDGLRELWQEDGKPAVKCVLVEDGARDKMRLRTRVVRSSTPFVTPRHYRKGRGEFQEWLGAEIALECGHHGLPKPRVTSWPEVSPGGFHWVEFRRNRKEDHPRAGFGLELEFPEDVPVPFSLGYGCHFGLGQFVGP